MGSPPSFPLSLRSLLVPASVTHSIPSVVASKCKPSCQRRSTSTTEQLIVSRRLQQRRASLQVSTRALSQTPSEVSVPPLCWSCMTAARKCLRRTTQSRTFRLEDYVVNQVDFIIYWPVMAGQEITFIN